jgi:hypothetical protein
MTTPSTPPSAIESGESGRVAYDYISTCRTCGYPLKGLPERRCPECGRSFDPYDPATMRVPGWIPRRRPAKSSVLDTRDMIIAATIATVLVSVGWLDNGRSALVMGLFYGSLLWPAVLLAYVTRHVEELVPPRDPSIRRPRGGPAWRRVVPALLLVTLVFSLRYDACPHARYWAIGPVTVFWTSVDAGGPCRNVRKYEPWLLLPFQR